MENILLKCMRSNFGKRIAQKLFTVLKRFFYSVPNQVDSFLSAKYLFCSVVLVVSRAIGFLSGRAENVSILSALLC